MDKQKLTFGRRLFLESLWRNGLKLGHVERKADGLYVEIEEIGEPVKPLNEIERAGQLENGLKERDAE